MVAFNSIALLLVYTTHVVQLFGAEFYPLYDGFFKCTALSCTLYWVSQSNFQNQAQMCTQPPLMNIFLDSSSATTNNIVLNSSIISFTSEQIYKYYYGENYISLDLYFIGDWTNGEVVLQWDAYEIRLSYTTTTSKFTKSLCGSTAYTVRTFKFVLAPYYRYPAFKITSLGGLVAVRNHHIYYQKCYYLCRTCYGPLKNQCLICNNGLAPISNECSDCSPDYPFIYCDFCFRSCDVTRVPDKNRNCQIKSSVTYLITVLYAKIYLELYANKIVVLYDKSRPIKLFH